jgi:cytochrome c oxidase cbb3-type subunit 1
MRTVGGFLFFSGAVLMLYNVIMTLVTVKQKREAGAIAAAV